MSKKKHTLEHIIDILKVLYGDGRSRFLKLLFFGGFSGVFSQWWLPFLEAIAVEKLGLREAKFEQVGMFGFVSGWILLATAIYLGYRSYFGGSSNAAGEFAFETLDTLSATVSPNPIHRIVDLLSNYHAIFMQLHHADSNQARLEHLENWRACHPVVWEGTNVRDDAIRRLADPAKEWLVKTGSSFVTPEDLDRVEEGANALSAFAISMPPMAMPCIYSKEHSSLEELEERWDEQSGRLMALGSLISRLKELAARSGQKWNGARE